MKLPTVEAALALMLEAVRPLPPQDTPLAQADGRWLVEDVTATRDQPPFDASAMDGWAVRSGDVAPGAVLDIMGESAAGHALDARIGPGQTARISTGAALPPGADRVVIQEEADREGDRVVLRASTDGARHVRVRGCDFREGEVLLRAGLRLNPWRIALAASAGRAVLRCGTAPCVAILSTGDELIEPGQSAGPHQIYNSGAPSLSAFASRHAGVAHVVEEPGRPVAVAGQGAPVLLAAIAGRLVGVVEAHVQSADCPS